MRPTNVRWRVLGMLLLLSIITYLDRICINSAAPAMREDLGLSTAQMGFVFSIFAVAYGLFEIPGGWMGDRFGPRKVLTRIVVWWSAFTAFTGMVTGYGQLMVVRFLFGAGEAGAYPNTSVTISRWLPARQRAQGHGWVWMASRLGGALSPLIVVPLLDLYDWRVVFYIFSSFGFVWAVIWWVWFRDYPTQMQSVNEAEVKLIGGAAEGAHLAPVGKMFSSGNLWVVLAMYHCFCYGSYWFLVWTASYLSEAKGLDAATLAGLTALPFFLGAGANLLGGFAGDFAVNKYGLKWGRRLIGAGGVGTAGLLMLASLQIADPIVAAVVLATAFAASDFMLPTCWAVCLDIGGDNAGAVTGAMNTAGQMGSAIVAAVYGGMVETWGWDVPLIFVAGMSLLSAALWFFIDPTKPLSSKPVTEDIGEEVLA